MKDKFKGLLAGLLIGATLTGGAAIAANTTTLYDVLTQGVKIVVDGKKLNPTDANGNKVEPMIYNGTTYLPVRAVANALGKAVYWDGPEYTVYLGDMDGKLEYPTVELQDLISITHSYTPTNALTDNYGNRYSRATSTSKYALNTFEYLLNMKYSRFKGILYVRQGETASGESLCKIIADGKTIYTSPAMTKASAPVFLDVNVSGYNDVKIIIQNGDGNPVLHMAEAGFYQ